MVSDKKNPSPSSSRKLNSPPAEETTPLIDNTKPLSSHPKTLANVFIAIVGAGVLGMPYAFKRTGWIMGLLILSFIAASTTYCMTLLVQIRRKLDSYENGTTNISSFGDLGFAVCGTLGRFVVDVLITLSQAGFCIGYLIFIANTLLHLFHDEPSSDLGLSSGMSRFTVKSLYIWGCFPFQLGLNSIKTLTHLAPLSIFADVVDIGAMGVVMLEDLRLIMRRRREVKAFGGVSVFFYGMGVALFGYEGIAMVLPIESEMKDNAKFNKILALSMGLTTLMYGAFGALGYFAFGDKTKDIITSNLGTGWISSLVQLGLCINLFFTFPLMMNPVYEIVERRFSGGRYCLWLRWLFVLIVSLVALFVPNFADFLSLVGSSVCCCLGFILPGLFHLLAFKDEQGCKGCSLDIGIMIFGVVLAISGTWFSLMEILSAKE
ncbi:hypothetical protein E1A91_D13G065200v1 [Gossypium mustelinum]|uniref:Amino acid transporter transmembrane domain-containing protein n=5 Tax=Gossypium TaxID=3633 RepID=A0A7J9FMV7_9ROSI|nr:hypothetical protein ES319_D13G063100v1 [Gossypium barbadense]MBA0786607.1 hypothetical protein [Gossypium trilobum]TYG36450.1 hypothetical protein ES288_D13G066700v1 [Gossypium darwinii]TYH33526.1 hypothetical protein ES332_D13G065900v1 [Gossypium tomentosum]TYI45825.1 hypothetical protein E1A91_D13G065200v1 [Gossypium mustelinum]